jgi:2-oxoglutarate ferredoxin oxidoreductase subunit alpha
MIETLQYALMTETPVVIAVSQRLGPATGGATQNAQGDVLFVAHATSGGYPIPVLCPVDAVDAYLLTAECFRIAEELRSPVILLTDKETSKTVESVDVGRLPARIEVPPRPAPAPGGPYVPYRIGSLEDVPGFAPVGGEWKVTATGSAHNDKGQLRKNDPQTLRQLEHLAAKVLRRSRELARVRWHRAEGARTLLVSYGVSARACREVARDLGREGCPVALLEVLSLFPVPVAAIAQAAEAVERVVVVEENGPGLYAREVRAAVRDADVRQVNAVGALIPPAAIAREVLR